MFSLERGGRRWVLRRPAMIAVERADEGMRREFRILRALDGTSVPHPAPVALCDDHEVLGCSFYVMERVEGRKALPVPAALDDDEGRAELTFAIVDALAALHQVDWRAAGLAGLGRPDGFHERQVARWSRQLASYKGRPLEGFGGIAAWLSEGRPATFEPTIMHGDYHMGNVLVAPDRPGRVVAVVDWETATIGDPLLDLAGFCEIWSMNAGAGFPERSGVVEHYSSRRGIDVSDLTYHEVLYNFRMTVLLEGIYQRSLHNPSREVQDQVGEAAMRFLSRAVELTGY